MEQERSALSTEPVSNSIPKDAADRHQHQQDHQIDELDPRPTCRQPGNKILTINTRYKQQAVPWQEEPDHQPGFREHDEANQGSSAGADKFFQSFRIVECAEKMEDGFEHACVFLVEIFASPSDTGASSRARECMTVTAL